MSTLGDVADVNPVVGNPGGTYEITCTKHVNTMWEEGNILEC